MLEDFPLSKEQLQEMEPPDEALVRTLEPIDKPVTCFETLLYLITFLIAFPTKWIHWQPWRIAAYVVAIVFCAFLLFNMVFPPRFSMRRASFFLAVIFQSGLFFS